MSDNAANPPNVPAASGDAAPAAASAASTETKKYFTGVVKSVLDGGSVVIRGQPRNGPPPERILALSEVDAPRMARRPQVGKDAEPDQPFAWEAREFLRKILVGKAILGWVSHTAGVSNREYGKILYGSNDPEKAEDVTTKLVAEGLAKVRDSCQDEKLKNAQEAAKTAEKGLWGADASKRVRSITWEVDNPRQLVDRMAGKPVQAVIEHVRDGSTVRAFLLPDFYHVTVMMSGVRSPSTFDGNEPFAAEALYFTESRLLQRDVQIILESVNNKNFVGSVVHPMGNIAEALLKEGLAKCVDWSLQCVTGGPEKFRKAQAEAKAKNLRLWRDYKGPSGPQVSDKDKAFTGRVVEIVNADAIVVKRSKTDTRKIHLASIRPPRLPEGAARPPKFRPLYDIPFMFDAREFLRKKLINQNVHVTVDYIQAANNDYPEKYCGTVTIGGVNVAEALVTKGFATVVRYAADNDQRSSHYDDLLAAEEKATKSSKGIHDKKGSTSRRIADVSGDVAKSKQFLPFLQRAGKMQGVVEFVASGSRFRVYIPRETCVITFLLSGVSCPRASRTMPDGSHSAAEPFGDEALQYVKEMTLQREVEIEVESIDKGGNFIGWMTVDNSNVSVQLVEEGYAGVFLMQSQDSSQYSRLIQIAEENAKARKAKRWANFVEQKVEDKEEEEETVSERKVNYEKVMVTEVTSEGKIFAQHFEEGPKLESLMSEIRQEFSANPPLAGAYQPKRGELCAAKFVDEEWYRAKIEKMSKDDVSVLYVDYGNRATIPKTRLGALPAAFTKQQPFAKEYALALCQMPQDEEYNGMSLKALREDLLAGPVNMNVEYRVTGAPHVSLHWISDKKDEAGDIIKGLIGEGLLMVDRKGGRRMAKMLGSYTEAMEEAKKGHLNIWEYGDITEDDAREFGVGRK